MVLFGLGLLTFLFLNLGDRPLWGVEGRWAEGVREMMLRGDWWVPTINGEPHVTKPLIPYWLIRISALAFGRLDELTVRLPVATCGLLTIVAFYALARRFFEPWWSLTAAGILATTWGFVGYARVAQSEIYQLAGIVSALAFYMWFREKKSFWGYLGFWFSALLAALSKGLPGFAVPVLVAMVDIVLNRDFRHLNPQNFGAAFLALTLYFLHYLGIARAMGSELPFYLIVRENLTQAVNPYDNREPFYVYFYYLPELFLPWTLFFLAALGFTVKNFRKASQNQRFLLLALTAVFLLFDLARARRSYYILPAVPLGVLLITYYLRDKIKNPDALARGLSYFYGFTTLFVGICLVLLAIFPHHFDFLPLKSRFLPLITGIFILGALRWCVKKRTSPWGLIFSYLILAVAGISIATPALTPPSEKIFGRGLAQFQASFPQAKLCGYRKISANLFFYIASPRPLPVYQELSKAVQNCDLVFFREKFYKKATSEIKILGANGELYAVDKLYRSKDPNKNYLLWKLSGKYLLKQPFIPYP